MRETHDLMTEWAGADAELLDGEADAMFDAVFPTPASSPIAPVVVMWPRRFALAAVLALAIGAGVWAGRPSPQDPYQGVKSRAGEVPLRVEFMAFAAKLGASPQVGRELGDQDVVSEGEALVFRYVLASPARLMLLSTWPQPEVLWTSDRVLEAGEREISDAGQALSMNPSPYAPRLELTLIAIPASRGDVTDAQSALSRCPRCVVVSRSLRVEGSP